MTVMKWVFVALAVLSLGGSFVGEMLANSALDSDNRKNYTKEQNQAQVAAVAGVAWAALAVGMAVGEAAATRRTTQVYQPPPQAPYGAGMPPYPPRQ